MPRQKKHKRPLCDIDTTSKKAKPASEPSSSECQALPYINAAKRRIKAAYGLDMPDDFYHFWSYCCDSAPEDPCNAFRCAGLLLVGPFEELQMEYMHHRASATENESSTPSAQSRDYFTHWRFFYDPPEFQTVIVGDRDSQYHLGYYRDEPSSLPVFVASNEVSKGCSLTMLGDNVFAATISSLSAKHGLQKDCRSAADAQKMACSLKEKADSLGLSLLKMTPSMKAREKLVVTRCFNNVGIVVPVTKDGVGYRPIPETRDKLKQICKDIVEGVEENRLAALDKLQELVTYVQFANDECDYGEGLELGLDLFCYGNAALHSFISNLLPVAYQLLRRPLFAQIVEAHLRARRFSLFT